MHTPKSGQPSLPATQTEAAMGCGPGFSVIMTVWNSSTVFICGCRLERTSFRTHNDWLNWKRILVFTESKTKSQSVFYFFFFYIYKYISFTVYVHVQCVCARARVCVCFERENELTSVGPDPGLFTFNISPWWTNAFILHNNTCTGEKEKNH